MTCPMVMPLHRGLMSKFLDSMIAELAPPGGSRSARAAGPTSQPARARSLMRTVWIVVGLCALGPIACAKGLSGGGLLDGDSEGEGDGELNDRPDISGGEDIVLQ